MPNIDLTQLQTATQKSDADLITAKAAATEHLRQTLEAFLSAFTSKYPASEQLAFADKKSAAMKVIASQTLNSVEQTLFDGERASTGETEADLAARVLPKATAFAQAVGAVSGLRAKYADLIDGAADAAALGAVETAMAVDLAGLVGA